MAINLEKKHIILTKNEDNVAKNVAKLSRVGLAYSEPLEDLEGEIVKCPDWDYVNNKFRG